MKTCPKCDGFGELVIKDEYGEPHQMNCGRCGGKGQVREVAGFAVDDKITAKKTFAAPGTKGRILSLAEKNTSLVVLWETGKRSVVGPEGITEQLELRQEER